MDDERYLRLYALFDLARRLEPTERKGFLELVGRVESPLRDDLKRLLLFAADGLGVQDALSEARIFERRVEGERLLDEPGRSPPGFGET